jgi:hypothetical protein
MTWLEAKRTGPVVDGERDLTEFDRTAPSPRRRLAFQGGEGRGGDKARDADRGAGARTSLDAAQLCPQVSEGSDQFGIG